MYKKVQNLMIEQGIPSHEADQHIKFMLNPGAISEAEMLEMYKTLSGMRGNPVGATANPQGNTQAQGATHEPAKEISVGENGMPPASVVAIGGERGGPEDTPITSTAKDHLSIDPNNA